MLRVTKAIIQDDREWIKRWVFGTFGVDVSDDLLTIWIAQASAFLMRRHGDKERKSSGSHISHSGYGWRIYNHPTFGSHLVEDYADDDWRMWFSSRLEEVKKWPPCGGQLSVTFNDYGCPLHVFFISLEETDEMLARLHHDPEKKKGGPSTPGIERTEIVLQPIDRVASLVVPDRETT
jgi:hypothetical protein